MASRLVPRRPHALVLPRRACRPERPPRRWMTPAPRPGDGPLLSRRADRELPEINQVRFRWARSLPVFAALVSVCAVSIFNYQKTSSPIVSSTLYALRTNARARELLGHDIYFKHQIPWIRGRMNQMQGRIDIYFTVKGSRGWATMRFTSRRPAARSLFETSEWSLTTPEGEWVDLLDGGDPFRGLLGGQQQQQHDDDDGVGDAGEGAGRFADLGGEAGADRSSVRGFRQQGALNR